MWWMLIGASLLGLIFSVSWYVRDDYYGSDDSESDDEYETEIEEEWL